MRVAAIWVPGFPLQALRRAVPELVEAPLAMAAGPNPRDRLVAVAAEAQELGVRPGMTAAQARQRSLQVVVRVTPPEVAAAAEAALEDAARSVAPHLRRHAPGEVLLDVGGSVVRWGSEEAVATTLWRACYRVGLEARVGVAGDMGVARLAARFRPPAHPGDTGGGGGESHRSQGVVVVPAGEERAFLAPLPVGMLEPSPPVVVALQRWGIRTAGALAALPRGEVILRLGAEGETLHRLACGAGGGSFIPDPPVEVVREGVSFEDALVALEPFLFVLNGVLGRLAARLELRGEGFAEVRLELTLEGHERYQAVIRLISPTREVPAVLPLLRLHLEAHPPGAPVEGAAVAVRPGKIRLVQGDLFGPPAPSPGKLATALVRLAALVGPDRVGAPGLADTHLPGERAVVPFAPPPWGNRGSPPVRPAHQAPGGAGDRASHLADTARAQPPPVPRRVRPVLPAHVTLAGQRPVAVHAAGLGGAVVALAGPYRVTGDWWTDRPFSRDAYDVATADGSVLCLCFDRLVRAWFVEGVYD